MAWVLRVEDGKGEEEQRTLPVGDIRIRVCSCGVVFWERNVDSRFVSSIVWDISSRCSGEVVGMRVLSRGQYIRIA